MANCAVCGKTFEPHRPTQRFCSHTCFGLSRRRPDPTCEVCGKVFPFLKGGKNRFCSQECWRAAQRNRVVKSCEVCGKTFDVVPSKAPHVFCCSRACRVKRMHALLTCRQCGKTVEVRRHVVNDGKNKGFCSYACAAEWQKGENHSNWQGGHDKWRGPNWKRQRYEARKRDNYTCQHCGVTEEQLGRPLDVHHITPWREFNGDYKTANRLSNLVSLCPSCHTSCEPRGANRRTHTTPQEAVQLQL